MGRSKAPPDSDLLWAVNPENPERKTAAQIAAENDVSERQCRSWIAAARRREGQPARTKQDTDRKKPQPEPIFLDLKVPRLDWREALLQAEQMQRIENDASVGQHSAKAEIPTSDPIMLVGTADWHLGSLATDHKSFMEHIEHVLKTDRLYLCVVGDETDNFVQFKSAAAVLGQVMTPKLQMQTLAAILHELVDAHKLLFTCWGNHFDEFNERTSGNSMRCFLNENRVPHLIDDGEFELKVGEQEYDMLALHKSRYNSFLNKMHGAKRAYQMRRPARIIWTAHTHEDADLETYHHYDKDNLLFHIGTFKLNDTYGRRYFGKPGLGTPSAVVFPDHDEIVPFRTVDQAEVFMKGLCG